MNLLSLAARAAAVDGTCDGDPRGDAREKRFDFVGTDSGLLRDAVDAERALDNEHGQERTLLWHPRLPRWRPNITQRGST
jgi:hypothetical protein